MAVQHRDIHAVVMAGGKGERFWPLSTYRRPKPFVEGLFARSLFRMTLDRLEVGLSPERIWVVTGEEHREVVEAQAPEIPSSHRLVEPIPRDTACAIAYAAMVLTREVGSDAVMLVVPCDHWIQPVEAFWDTIDRARTVLDVDPDAEVVLGIRPSRPETGYGYIQAGEPVGTGVYRVEAFHEKPDPVRALRYLESGRFFWNAGIFLWRVERIVTLIQRFLTDMHQSLAMAFQAWGTTTFAEVLRGAYERISPISIDYGVMEKTDRIVMVEATFTWDDVGQWEALDRLLPREPVGDNVVWGPATVLNSRNCIVVNTQGWVGVLGLEDIVVVHDRGRVLVMRKGMGHRLKDLVHQVPSEFVER